MFVTIQHDKNTSAIPHLPSAVPLAMLPLILQLADTLVIPLLPGVVPLAMLPVILQRTDTFVIPLLPGAVQVAMLSVLLQRTDTLVIPTLPDAMKLAMLPVLLQRTDTLGIPLLQGAVPIAMLVVFFVCENTALSPQLFGAVPSAVWQTACNNKRAQSHAHLCACRCQPFAFTAHCVIVRQTPFPRATTLRHPSGGGRISRKRNALHHVQRELWYLNAWPNGCRRLCVASDWTFQ